MKYNKIALIGMMGSGKTTISKYLSEKMQISYYDLDFEFEKKYNIKIADFFEKYSENLFRKFESDILLEFSKKNEFIISTGGGIILSDENRKILFNRKILSIYLKASVDTIFERIKNDKTRPLLLDCNMEEKIEEILKKREKYYQKADIIVETDNKTPDVITNEIMEKIEK